MTISIMRVAGPVVAGALLLTGCGDSGTTATRPTPDPTRAVPTDICLRIDYSPVTPAFGRRMPIPPPEDADRGPGVRCDASFFGDADRAAGFVQVTLRSYDTVEAARTGFDRTVPSSTATPFAAGPEIVADAVRYQQSPQDARIEARAANLVLEVRLAALTQVSDGQAAQLPPATARLMARVLELVPAD